MLSEIRQTEKVNYYIVSLICGTQGIVWRTLGEGKSAGEKSDEPREMNQERLWTLGNKWRVLEERGGGMGDPEDGY